MPSPDEHATDFLILRHALFDRSTRRESLLSSGDRAAACSTSRLFLYDDTPCHGPVRWFRGRRTVSQELVDCCPPPPSAAAAAEPAAAEPCVSIQSSSASRGSLSLLADVADVEVRGFPMPANNSFMARELVGCESDISVFAISSTQHIQQCGPALTWVYVQLMCDVMV